MCLHRWSAAAAAPEAMEFHRARNFTVSSAAGTNVRASGFWI